jgi:hypothetical protein
MLFEPWRAVAGMGGGRGQGLTFNGVNMTRISKHLILSFVEE